MTVRRVSSYELSVPLSFRPPTGAPLPATLQEVTYVSIDGVVRECRLVLELEPATYETVDRERLFHLDPDVRGPGADRFRPGGTLRMEVGLAPALAPDLAAAAPESRLAGARLAALAASGEADDLLATDSWYARSVSAAVDLPPELAAEGTLRAGYATAWAEDGRVLELPMLALVEEALAERGWTYAPIDDETGFWWPMESAGGRWSTYALVRGDERRFAVYSVLDIAAPAERRAGAAALIARANWGLPVGNWEFDLDSGAIRYKTSVDVPGSGLSLDVARMVIERNLSVVDAYLGAFTAFVDGAATVDEALTRAEG